MPSSFLLNINSYVYNTVAAATFVFWDYCLTGAEEVEYIWRRELTLVTALFTVIRYIPIISSILIMINNITPFVPTSTGTCFAWLVISTAWTMVLMTCFEILLAMRVLALYGQRRFMRNGLIALLSCANVTRIIIFAVGIPAYQYGDYLGSEIHQSCYKAKFSSINPSALFIVEILPEMILFCLAVIKLIQTKRDYDVSVSKLLVVIVRDGTWAFILVFVLALWNIIQFEVAKEDKDTAIVWVAPVIGFTGSRLILNLRSEGHTPPEVTNLDTFEINFSKTEGCESIQESF